MARLIHSLGGSERFRRGPRTTSDVGPLPRSLGHCTLVLHCLIVPRVCDSPSACRRSLHRSHHCTAVVLAGSAASLAAGVSRSPVRAISPGEARVDHTAGRIPSSRHSGLAFETRERKLSPSRKLRSALRPRSETFFRSSSGNCEQTRPRGRTGTGRPGDISITREKQPDATPRRTEKLDGRRI